MLKIKDDVDLKELERFGFIKKEKEQTATTQTKFIGYDLQADIGGDFIFVKAEDREIIWLINYHTNIEDTIFDLIQAGLVEKTEKNMI